MSSTEYGGLPSHGRYPYSPIIERPTLRWPGGKGLAVYFAVNVEHFAYGKGLGPAPTAESSIEGAQRAYAWRDYGVRVGIWRLFDLFDELGLPAAFLLNAYAALEYPQIVNRIQERGDEIIAHGRTNAERLGTAWDHDQLRGIEETTDILAKANGDVRPTGWMSPGREEGAHTLELLTQAGYEYVLDWPMDDQPIWMTTQNGQILSVPYPIELNDLPTQIKRGFSALTFAQMIEEQFLEMLRQAESTGLVMGISLHTFISGQPYQIRILRRVLSLIAEHREAIWLTRPGEIARAIVESGPQAKA